MGFLDVLANIGGAVAAPFTGGFSLLAGPALRGIEESTAPQGRGPSVGQTVGQGISGATQAAGQNRLNQEQLALQANEQNLQGLTATEKALLDRSLAEQQQRQAGLRDVYRSSAVANPRVSPFDPTGGPRYSSQYMQAATNMGNQGANLVSRPASYGISSLPPVMQGYQPLDIKNLQAATGTQPGLLERIGQFAGPGLSALGAIGGALRNRQGSQPGGGQGDMSAAVDAGTMIDMGDGTYMDATDGTLYDANWNPVNGDVSQLTDLMPTASETSDVMPTDAFEGIG